MNEISDLVSRWHIGRIHPTPDVEPTGWTLEKLCDIARLESGHTPSRNRPDYWDGDIPWLSLHDSKTIEGKTLHNTKMTVSALGLANSSARLLPEGTVALSRTATIGKVAILGREMATSQDFACYICGPRLLNSYLAHLFRGMEVEWERLMAGSTHNTIYMPSFENMQILVPPMAEQEAIAEALSDADALIEGLERLIAKKRLIKQGAMQDLLTAKRRLPGFSGEWGAKTLGEICRLEMGGTPPRQSSAYWGKGYPWLSIADLKGKVVTESKEEISQLGADRLKVIPKGTLLMSFKLSIGRVAFAGRDLFTNEAICAFFDLSEHPGFLYYALQRVDFALYGKQAVKGYTLNKESLRAVEVRFPTRAEQAAISDILDDMDAEIQALDARLEKARQVKEGMMQNLLTGRIRLI